MCVFLSAVSFLFFSSFFLKFRENHCCCLSFFFNFTAVVVRSFLGTLKTCFLFTTTTYTLVRNTVDKRPAMIHVCFTYLLFAVHTDRPASIIPTHQTDGSDEEWSDDEKAEAGKKGAKDDLEELDEMQLGELLAREQRARHMGLSQVRFFFTISSSSHRGRAAFREILNVRVARGPYAWSGQFARARHRSVVFFFFLWPKGHIQPSPPSPHAPPPPPSPGNEEMEIDLPPFSFAFCVHEPVM